MNVYNLMKTELVPMIKKMADVKGDVDAYNKLIDPYNTLTDKLDKVEIDAQTAQLAFASKIGMQVNKN